MGLAVSGRKANGPVIPGSPSGSLMWGMDSPLALNNLDWFWFGDDRCSVAMIVNDAA
jgi:hypothetical protein